MCGRWNFIILKHRHLCFRITSILVMKAPWTNARWLYQLPAGTSLSLHSFILLRSYGRCHYSITLKNVLHKDATGGPTIERRSRHRRKCLLLITKMWILFILRGDVSKTRASESSRWESLTRWLLTRTLLWGSLTSWLLTRTLLKWRRWIPSQSQKRSF